MTVEVGKRALACRGWRWLERMRSTTRGTVVQVDEVDGSVVTVFDELGAILVDAADVDEEMIPDLDDAATLGIIEHELLPSAWGRCSVDLEIDWLASGGWWAEITIYPDSEHPVFRFEVRADSRNAALAEVLVAALEAAP